MYRALVALVMAAVISGVGCTRVEVHKNPSAQDKGIRYYRPKPYLFITPGGGGGAGPTFSVEQNKPLEIKQAQSQAGGTAAEIQKAAFTAAVAQATQGETVYPMEGAGTCQQWDAATDRPGAISIDLVYMPDFAEEYSIQLKPGLGVGELSLELEDGWNLTTIGMKTDQQTDEIIASTAQLLSSVSGFAGGGARGMDGKAHRNAIGDKCDIYATNVPFGFYEAIIATDRCGRKQLFGWRYVGFMPFQCCPVQGCGMEQVHCQAECDKIFGLVWVNGILQFKQIAEIPRNPVPPTTSAEAGADPSSAPEPQYLPPETPSGA